VFICYEECAAELVMNPEAAKPAPPAAALPAASLILRLNAIEVVVAGIAGLFAYVCGWLTPFPRSMSEKERLIATASEKLLYALMIVLPVVGWAMLSAARYPVVMFGPIHLPPILPASSAPWAVLRKTHAMLAYLLFLTFLAHLSAVFIYTFVIRDRLPSRMALWPTRSGQAKIRSDVVASSAAVAAVKSNH